MTLCLNNENPRGFAANTTLDNELTRFIDREVPSLIHTLRTASEEDQKIARVALENATENIRCMAELARQKVNIKAMAAVEACMDRAIRIGAVQMEAVEEYRKDLGNAENVKAIVRQSHRAQDMLTKNLEILASLMKTGGMNGKTIDRGSSVTVNVAGIAGNPANAANALLLDAVSGARRVRKDHDSRQAKPKVNTVGVQLGSGADSPGDDRSGVERPSDRDSDAEES